MAGIPTVRDLIRKANGGPEFGSNWGKMRQSAGCSTTPSPTITKSRTGTPNQTPTCTQTCLVTCSLTPTATLTRSPSPTFTYTRSRTNTSFITPACVTCSPTPTCTRTMTASPTVTDLKITPEITFTATNTRTRTRTSSHTPTCTPTVTHTCTVTATNTQTSTCTQTRSKTPNATVTKSFTNTATPTRTLTCTNTVTNTVTHTCTQTSTPTNTKSVTPTYTKTRTNTPTSTRTPTQCATATPTPTYTRTRSRYHTPTVTCTSCITPTQTPTRTRSISPTRTNTPSKTCCATPTITQTCNFTSTSTKTRTRAVTNTPSNYVTPTPSSSSPSTPVGDSCYCTLRCSSISLLQNYCATLAACGGTSCTATPIFNLTSLNPLTGADINTNSWFYNCSEVFDYSGISFRPAIGQMQGLGYNIERYSPSVSSYPSDQTGYWNLSAGGVLIDSIANKELNVTLITPQHGITATHFAPDIGSSIHFYDTSGTLHKSTIAATYNLGSDATLVKLDTPITSSSVKKYVIGKKTITGSDSIASGPPSNNDTIPFILAAGKSIATYPYEFDYGLNIYASWGTALSGNNNQNYFRWWEASNQPFSLNDLDGSLPNVSYSISTGLISGDSGGPIFVTFNNDMLLVGAITSTTAGSNVGDPDIIDLINTGISSLGNPYGYTISTQEIGLTT